MNSNTNANMGANANTDTNGNASASCPAARRAAHRRLARELEACPHARGVQFHPAGDAAERPYAATEVLASVTIHGTVHPAVGAIVADSILEPAVVQDANSPDYKRVLVR